MQNNQPFGSGGDPFASREAKATAAASTRNRDNDARYAHNNYLVRRKLMKLIGADFYLDGPNGELLGFAHQKGFKLKEAIRLYTGEDKAVELLQIQARSIIDFSATYDVTDSATGQRLGSLKRKGLKSSFLRDEWLILDAQEKEIGHIIEESMALAMVRRYIEITALFLPQKYDVFIGGVHVADFQQNKNPLVTKMAMDFSRDQSGVLDRRLGIASAILLCAIEGKQG